MARAWGHAERHMIGRAGWLRASLLGANDGLISTACLIIGVAAAASDKSGAMVAGVAGLVAGAMSMAAGEYVSVSSQSDSEAADLARERRELVESPEAELAELAGIYRERGLSFETAQKVAEELTAADAFGSHARDELGIHDLSRANPVQAALASAAAFATGAALPLLVLWLTPEAQIVRTQIVTALVLLAALGAAGAKAGGAPITKPMLRVTFWGAVAMAMTAGVGALIGTAV